MIAKIVGAKRILVFNYRKTRNQNFFSLGELKTPPDSFLLHKLWAEARHNAREANASAEYVVIFIFRTICSASVEKGGWLTT